MMDAARPNLFVRYGRLFGVQLRLQLPEAGVGA